MIKILGRMLGWKKDRSTRGVPPKKKTGESDNNGSDICCPLPLILTQNCPHPCFPAHVPHLRSWIPVLTYILLFYSTSILCHDVTANSRVPPHPNPAPSLPTLLVFGARVGSGFWMGVSNFRNCIAGWLLTWCHVTHQRPCCTHATLPLHILWCARTHLHTDLLVERQERLCHSEVFK